MMETEKAKIFIGGMSRETSEEALRSYFSKYGRVVTSLVAKDRVSGLSRGFGFVSFSDSSFADKALHDSHVILGKKVDVKKAIPRNDQGQYHQQRNGRTMSNHGEGNGNADGNELRTKKIFVGGLPSSLTEDQFKNHFERFGKIVDVVVMQDNLTNRPRGFGFVTFDSEDSVDKAVEKNFHELEGKTVEVKKAVPKEDINCGMNSGYMSEGDARVSFRNSSEHGYGPGYGIPPSYVPVPPYGSYGMGVYGSYPMMPYSRHSLPFAPVPFRHFGPMVFPSPHNYPFLCPAFIGGSIAHAMAQPNGNVKLTDISGGNEHQASDTALPSVEGNSRDDSSSMKGSENGVAC